MRLIRWHVVKIDRRQLVVGGAIGAAALVIGCRARAVGLQVTPEGFGAAGDGISDDYEPMKRVVGAINSARGGTIVLAPGRTYYLDHYVTDRRDLPDLMFADCAGVAIEGNGATIAVKGDFTRSQETIRSLAGLIFRNCTQVSVRNLQLVGNVDRTVRLAGIREPPSHGLLFQGCSNVAIDRVIARHFAGDGLYIRESKTTGLAAARPVSREFRVSRSKFLFNARQGLSVVQLRRGVFEDCDFSYTGFVDNREMIGPYGGHSPGAGVDVEPNNTPFFGNHVDALTGELSFRRCRMIGNYGAAFVAAKYALSQRFVELVTLDDCHLECNDGLTGGQDGFIFDVHGGQVTDCTLRMKDKTAYLGWYPQSDADPVFQSNEVSGRSSLADHPIFAVRSTRGTPVIERNRFVSQQASAKPRSDASASIVYVDNERAIFRQNALLFAAAALPRSGSTTVGAYIDAAMSQRNSYDVHGAASGKGAIAIIYGKRTRPNGEIYGSQIRPLSPSGQAG